MSIGPTQRSGRPRHHHRLDQRGEVARAVPEHGLRPRGRRAARRRRRRQRVHRRHARARRVAVPGRARRRLAEPGLRAREQPRRDDVRRRRYVLFLNPDTEIVDGTFGELVAAIDARPDVGLAGVKQLTGDGTLWPTIRYFPSVGARARRGASPPSAGRARPRWAGERELDLSLYEQRGRVRLDLGLVHVLPARGAAERRAARRALLHLLRGARPLPAHEARGLGDPPPADDDDRPPRRQGRAAAEDGRPGRLHATAVRAQALRRAAAGRVPGRRRRSATRARRGTGPWRGGRAASRRRAARAAHAGRARPSRRSARRPVPLSRRPSSPEPRCRPRRCR